MSADSATTVPSASATCHRQRSAPTCLAELRTGNRPQHRRRGPAGRHVLARARPARQRPVVVRRAHHRPPQPVGTGLDHQTHRKTPPAPRKSRQHRIHLCTVQSSAGPRAGPRIRECRPRCSPPSCSRRPARTLWSRGRALARAGRHPGPGSPARVWCPRRQGSARPHCSAAGPHSWNEAGPPTASPGSRWTRATTTCRAAGAHLVAARGRRSRHRGRGAGPAARTDPVARRVGALVNEVARPAADREPDRRWILVLDDYHLVDGPEVHEAWRSCWSTSRRSVHLVISTRADPPLPLARLRARGELVEIRAADLRFTPDEAAAYLNDVDRPGPRRRATSPRWRSGPRAGSPRCSSPRSRSQGRDGHRRIHRRVRRRTTGTSSTTWSRRCCAHQPDAVREFLLRHGGSRPAHRAAV